MVIYGKGWGRQLPSCHDVKPFNISLRKVARLYGAHKYVLNVINSDNVQCGVNMRCFEAMAAKAVLVTEKVDDLPLCFDVANDLVLISDFEKQVEDLEIGSRFHGISVKGAEKVLQSHIYDERVKSILS